MRFKAMFIRVIKELIRDKRTLALMLVAPMLVLTLMNLVFNSNAQTHVKIGIDSSVSAQISGAFPSDEVKVSTYSHVSDIPKVMNKDNLDAFIQLKGDTFYLTFENEDPSNTAKIKAIFSQVMTTQKMNEMGATIQKLAMISGQKVSIQNFDIKNAYIYGDENSTFFDKIFPILIGFFVFFFVFLISGIALLRERTSGTLERLLATPIKRSEIVFGYLFGYGLFAILQTLLIVMYSIFILNLAIAGSIGWVILTNILIALVALSMGIFVSTFANSEFQMIQFIPIIVVPQVFFSGIIASNSMASWVRVIGYIFPLNYGGRALSAIMLKGEGAAGIAFDLGILILFIVGFTVLNILGLKRYRKV
jgi:ABC-2 type transport system permease protein